MRKGIIIALIFAFVLLAVGCTDHGKDNDKADMETSTSSRVTEAVADTLGTTSDSTTAKTDQTDETAPAVDTDAVAEKESSGTTVTQQQTDPPAITTQTGTNTESPPVVTNSNDVDLPIDSFD